MQLTAKDFFFPVNWNLKKNEISSYVLNLIIPYRHEREGYFKGLYTYSGCTNSELKG